MALSLNPARTGFAGVVVAGLLASAGPAGAANPSDLRLGYIDSAKIFQEYTVAKEAQERFNRQVQGWHDEATAREKAVTQLRAEVRDQAPVLSALKRQEKEEALQRAISEYERFIQDIWGPEGKAAKENERATGEVVQQIRAAVEKVAGDKGLWLVVDAASGFLIYADRSLDLTSEVMAELNARSQAGAPR